MSALDLLLLAIALAMDCFTVSIVSGVILRRRHWRVILQMSILFGLFQALMPLLGWGATVRFANYIEAYDHWVAFGLLTFLGGKMIRDAFHPEEARSFNPRRLATQLVLAIATSIDALAVGISFAVTGYHAIASLLWPLIIIGAVSFGFGVAGQLLGLRFGNIVSRRLKPELLGGILLILIGLKVLISHMA